MDADLHRQCVNTLKGLAMDAVQKANSGHPGMPMGMADVATVLFTRFVKFDASAPDWADRDRFVLSGGHGSMLLYSVLHLSGYDVSLDDLKAFRQWGSKTPGHPEAGHTPGVETTTGPLGQGFANAVGMAIAERTLREEFGAELCDHWTWAMCGDGDLMEGISCEAASMAGHLGLGRLVVLWDDNHISIDGGTHLAFTEDVGARFEAQGWHVQKVDGHDRDAVSRAIEAARGVTDRPSLIACRTVIGQGSPSFEGTARTHGAPLGVEEVAKTKARLGMDPDATFVVPEAVANAFRDAGRSDLREAWEGRVAGHAEAERFRSWVKPDWRKVAESVAWPVFEAGKGLATRKANAKCLQAIIDAAPNVVGGSADLAESNGVHLGRPSMNRERFAGTGNIHYGVREHAMAAVNNGIAYHGGLRAYGATFLVFHDYQRPAVRLSALVGLPVVHIYSHDSFWLGEDGPTHQPIETLLALRATPKLDVWRPADATETALAWRQILERTDRPSAIVLTRQDLPIIDRSRLPEDGVARGGYVLVDAEDPKVVLMGTGSEVALCVQAAELLAERGIAARVVSLPNRERFWEQDADWRASILPVGVPRVAVEAGVTLGWERYVGDGGAIVGIDHFGASAPAKVLAEKFGFTPARVAEVAQGLC
ncbi:MAG: transketolase [Alphaproteobacteria bacterium]|nr:transketolase [Alphaproteobacteria bacterium]